MPQTALLQKYAESDNCYTDCFSTQIAGQVSLEHFMVGFLTTPIFKLERWILKLALGKPSTDEEARLLAKEKIESFSAWTVETRNETQLLMSDYSGKTRFWIMVEHDNELKKTRLYFGSAVLPNKDGMMPKSIWFKLMMQFHRLYSIILLWSAKSNI